MKPFLWLDFDGVLRHWPAGLFEMSESELSKVHAAAFSADLLELAITGQISDEDWRTAVAQRLSQSVEATEAHRLVALWSSPCGEIDHALLMSIYGLGFKGRIGLITNATSRLMADLKKLGIENEFAQIINSSELGSAKPSAEIFQHALSLSGHPSLFVDDSAKNCAAAESTGFIAHHFTRQTAFEEWLRSAL